MNKRPLSVTIIGCIFIIVGIVGFAYHITEFDTQRPFGNDSILILLVRLLAALGGVFLLRGSGWARWFLIVWIAYHVVLSAFHPLFELIVHSLLLVVIAYFLYRPKVSAWVHALQERPHPETQ